jgi:subtilisin family serine protease
MKRIIIVLIMTVVVHGRATSIEGRMADVEKPRDLGDRNAHARLIETIDFINSGRARAIYNVDGSGLSVAVLDTGIRSDHQDFEGKVLETLNFTHADNADDNNGHGTHVAGIIVANGVHKGIAPGASVVSLKILSDQLSYFSWFFFRMRARHELPRYHTANHQRGGRI